MDAVEHYIAQLNALDDRVRDAAASELASLQDRRAVKPLVDCYLDLNRRPQPDIDGDVSWAIPYAIMSFGEDAANELLMRSINGAVIWLLGKLGHPLAVNYLIDIFNENVIFEERFAIIYALGEIRSQKAVPFLEIQRDQVEPTLKSWVEEALKKISQL